MFLTHFCGKTSLEPGMVFDGMGPFGGQLPLDALATEEVRNGFTFFDDNALLFLTVVLSHDRIFVVGCDVVIGVSCQRINGVTGDHFVDANPTHKSILGSLVTRNTPCREGIR